MNFKHIAVSLIESTKQDLIYVNRKTYIQTRISNGCSDTRESIYVNFLCHVIFAFVNTVDIRRRICVELGIIA